MALQNNLSGLKEWSFGTRNQCNSYLQMNLPFYPQQQLGLMAVTNFIQQLDQLGVLVTRDKLAKEWQ